LDIGANIGRFSLAAAYSGYNVVAVELFEENRQLFKRSLCMAPDIVRKLVTIVPYALGPAKTPGITDIDIDTVNTVCELWQYPAVNRGDTHTICSGTLDRPG